MSGTDSSDPEARARRVLRGLSEVEGDHAALRPAAEAVPQLARYEVRERLGQGGTAVVYRAWDRELKRTVALKVLSEGMGFSEIARQRFRREAQTAASLAHPNVVTVYDAGEEAGRLYLVMELVEGQPFRTAGDLRPRVALLEKAARGVAAAHEGGVVHRDLKPGNILVTASGEPKVGDFGLAHLAGSAAGLTRTGAVLGTPLYMAPEQVEGRSEDITPRTDVYALGAILYEILTGRPPHVGESAMEIYGKIVGHEAAPPRKLDPRAPPDLETVALKALAKDPARRYPDAGAFAGDLRRFLSGEPVEARPESLTQRLFRRVRKNRLPTGLAAAAIVAALLAVAVWQRGESERRSALQALREKAGLALSAALKLRRAGANEGMTDFLPDLRSAYDGAVRRAPDLPEVDYLLGRMHRALMDDSKALEHQERALAKDATYAPSLYEHAVLLSKSYGGRLQRAYESLETDTRKAPTLEDAEGAQSGLAAMRALILEECQRLERAAVSEAHALAARGILAYHRGRFDDARELLRKAVEKDPLLEEAWETLGRGEYAQALLTPERRARQRHLDRAEQWFTEGHSRDRGYLPHLLGRVAVRGEIGNLLTIGGESPVEAYARAEEDLAEILRLAPRGFPQTRAEAFGHRGVIRTHRGIFRQNRGEDPTPDFDAAEKDLDEIVLLDAENRQVWWRRAAVRIRRGMWRMERGGDPLADFSAAEADLAEALRRTPARPVLWNELGYLRTQKGLHQMSREEDPRPEFRAAEEGLTEAIRLKKTYTVPRRMRASLRISWGTYLSSRGEDPHPLWSAAEEDLVVALEQEEHPTVWLLRGRLHARRAEFDAAEADFGRALALNKASVEALTERAELRSRRGEASRDRARARQDFALALQDLDEALRINPSLKEKLSVPIEILKKKLADLEKP